MSKSACVGSVVVTKFFQNTRFRFRLNDKVFYTHKGESKIWSILIKEGKYLTLKSIDSEETVENIKITDVRLKNNNDLITRTLGKVGVINSQYQGTMPRNNELWLSVIVKENCPGNNIGCFIIDPIMRISDEKIDRLIPGMYTEEIKDKVLFIYPKKLKDNDGDDIYWILPITHRSGIECSAQLRDEEINSVIVELGKMDVKTDCHDCLVHQSDN
jgi:hypothetical protein